MKDRATTTKDPQPDLAHGDRVIVAQEGIREWEGEVLSVKPGTHRWMVEVRRDDNLTWSVSGRFIRRVDS